MHHPIANLPALGAVCIHDLQCHERREQKVEGGWIERKEKDGVVVEGRSGDGGGSGYYSKEREKRKRPSLVATGKWAPTFK